MQKKQMELMMMAAERTPAMMQQMMAMQGQMDPGAMMPQAAWVAWAAACSD